MTKLKQEEIQIRINQVNELKELLVAFVPDENSLFKTDEQRMISILTADERNYIKSKMLELIDKYFV